MTSVSSYNSYGVCESEFDLCACMLFTTRQIFTIDVSNIPSNQVSSYVDEMIYHYNGIPYIKKSRSKTLMYDLINTIGIAGSFGI